MEKGPGTHWLSIKVINYFTWTLKSFLVYLIMTECYYRDKSACLPFCIIFQFTADILLWKASLKDSVFCYLSVLPSQKTSLATSCNTNRPQCYSNSQKVGTIFISSNSVYQVLSNYFPSNKPRNKSSCTLYYSKLTYSYKHMFLYNLPKYSSIFLMPFSQNSKSLILEKEIPWVWLSVAVFF